MVVKTDGERDTLTLIVTLLVLPFIVHMLHAPLTATFAVAVAAWPLAAVTTAMLYDMVRTRRERER